MDLYSRTISLLRIFLPLAALVLLSPVFLMSQRIRPTAQIPFAPKEIEDRIAGHQVTAPFYTGVTKAGHAVMISAARALPSQGDKVAQVNEIGAEIRMIDGTRLLVLSNNVRLVQGGTMAELEGNVRIHTSSNLQIVTKKIEASLDELDVQAPEQVQARGPLGDLKAGSLRIFTETQNGPAQIRFHKGVKLIYDPGNRER